MSKRSASGQCKDPPSTPFRLNKAEKLPREKRRRRPMEVTIRSTAKFRDHYEISLGEKISLTTTVVRDQDYKLSEPVVREWVNGVRRMCGNKKRNAQQILVGLSASHSIGYANGYLERKGSNKENSPYRLLQLCVGNHCLLFGLFTYGGPIPKVLKDFLYGGTRVVGLGIDKMADKLERDYGFLIPQRVELRKLAMEDGACEGRDLSKCDLEAVARAVLEGKVDVARPSKMSWFKDGVGCEYSDDLIKYASIEAITAQRIGTKPLGNRK
ncbi:uncharacterized protein LOC115736133 [Rhodamnia argentea]|uniref:Uncharacterized protein LOC115736133 n=1 Tax=Rhodamnia argentea TaxID=178133 RepID=A0ABM3H2E7_9MYRT|nr:uncharacterized protein LOC115736133 [Rhodamnia argentea]